VANSPSGISALNKSKVSTKDIVTYLDSLNVANEQVLKVLQKKPSLPGYEKLPWVLESKIDKNITAKLKNKKHLSLSETMRLKKILNSALDKLRKGHSFKSATTRRMEGLQNYIDQLG